MIEIIPAMDIMNGRCVRLRQVEAVGLRRLHLVDLDGARNGRIVHLHVLERIARDTSLKTDFSGGVRTSSDLKNIFDAGAAMVAIGSRAVTHSAQVLEWAAQYGPERMLLAADVHDDHIVTRGWQHHTRLHVLQFLEDYYQADIRNVFCTDVRSDGMMSGPALPLYRQIRERFPDLQLTASGGVRNIADILALAAAGCRGVIAGRAFYERKITAEDIQKLLTHDDTHQKDHTLS
jgi:phosphoribosylformimino-5-aminoimidazole carboxamide ribotide isomerase